MATAAQASSAEEGEQECSERRATRERETTLSLAERRPSCKFEARDSLVRLMMAREKFSERIAEWRQCSERSDAAERRSIIDGVEEKKAATFSSSLHKNAIVLNPVEKTVALSSAGERRTLFAEEADEEEETAAMGGKGKESIEVRTKAQDSALQNEEATSSFCNRVLRQRRKAIATSSSRVKYAWNFDASSKKECEQLRAEREVNKAVISFWDIFGTKWDVNRFVEGNKQNEGGGRGEAAPGDFFFCAREEAVEDGLLGGDTS